MSVREYVGARYVPLFADPIQWSNQNTYEPLTIVVNQGASYTSRQFVPVGIDISNEEYWALTGNYNAQVEQYRQEVQQLNDDVEENANNIESLNQITSELAHYGEFKNKTGIFVTDSWGRVGVYNVTKPYFMVAADMLGMKEMINLGVGSTGYLYPNSTSAFQGRLAAWVAANPSKVADIDYVFVCGSTNDYQYVSATQIRVAIVNFVNYAQATFPNATVVLMPQWAVPNRNIANVAIENASLYSKIYIECAAAYINNTFSKPIIWLDNAWNALLGDTYNNSFMFDKVHPNQAGHNYLGKVMANSLNGQPSRLPLNPDDFASMKVYYNTTVGAPVNINTAKEATITANQTVCYCEQNHLKFKIAIAVSDLPEGVTQLYIAHPAFLMNNPQQYNNNIDQLLIRDRSTTDKTNYLGFSRFVTQQATTTELSDISSMPYIYSSLSYNPLPAGNYFISGVMDYGNGYYA